MMNCIPRFCLGTATPSIILLFQLALQLSPILDHKVFAQCFSSTSSGCSSAAVRTVDLQFGPSAAYGLSLRGFGSLDPYASVDTRSPLEQQSEYNVSSNSVTMFPSIHVRDQVPDQRLNQQFILPEGARGAALASQATPTISGEPAGQIWSNDAFVYKLDEMGISCVVNYPAPVGQPCH